MRAVLVLTLVAGLGLGLGLYVTAGRAAGPIITIEAPTSLVGRESTFAATIEAPNNALNAVNAVIAQGGRSYALFSLDDHLMGIKRLLAFDADTVVVLRDAASSSRSGCYLDRRMVAVRGIEPRSHG